MGGRRVPPAGPIGPWELDVAPPEEVVPAGAWLFLVAFVLLLLAPGWKAASTLGAACCPRGRLDCEDDEEHVPLIGPPAPPAAPWIAGWAPSPAGGAYRPVGFGSLRWAGIVGRVQQVQPGERAREFIVVRYPPRQRRRRRGSRQRTRGSGGGGGADGGGGGVCRSLVHAPAAAGRLGPCVQRSGGRGPGSFETGPLALSCSLFFPPYRRAVPRAPARRPAVLGELDVTHAGEGARLHRAWRKRGVQNMKNLHEGAQIGDFWGEGGVQRGKSHFGIPTDP